MEKDRKIIQEDIKKIKLENCRLKVTHPLAEIHLSAGLMLAGVLSKSQSLQMLGFSLMGLSLLSLNKKKTIERQLQQNKEKYFYKAVDLDLAIKEDVRKIMDAASQEEDPACRQYLIYSVRNVKRENLIRQEDKKALFGLSGRKRRGLARGLRNLRHHMKYMTFNEYVKCRENILSYY